jgi:hypothetical protein
MRVNLPQESEAHHYQVGHGGGGIESLYREGCSLVPCNRHHSLEDLSLMTDPPLSCLGLGERWLCKFFCF